jgi:hypothetical protein
MAFGLLGSIIPQVNKNEIFYTASSSDLAIGKVSISSKNYNPVKVRLGISTDNLNIEYLIYNKFINYGETFETDNIHLGEEQKLVARSTDPNVNFLFYGETIDESGNPVKSGLLASVQSTNTQKKVLYTAPQDSNAVITLSVCNLDSQPGKARIGISSTVINSFDSSEYLEYDVEIGPNQTYTRTEIKLNAGQTLICSSNEDSNINFLCHGQLIYGVQASEDLYVAGNLGVGTLTSRQKLDVIGNGLISGSLNVGQGVTIGGRLNVNSGLNVGSGLTVNGGISGIITPSSLNQSLVGLGTLPMMDGSNLIGVIGTGSGIIIEDDSVIKGVSTTLDFGDDISVDYTVGLSTISLSDSVNVKQNLTVATNKFSVNGVTGNTQVAGTLGISSTLSVSGNINALNNKVINVGSATSSTDATNKNYVDTRSIAMSIALS